MCIQNNVMTLIPPLEQLGAVVRQSCIRRADPLREYQGDASGGGECRCESEGGVKGSASLLATQSIFIQPMEEEVPCCSGPSKNQAHTDQTKAAEGRVGLSLPCLSRYLRVHWGGWQHVIMPAVGTPASDGDSNLYTSL